MTTSTRLDPRCGIAELLAFAVVLSLLLIWLPTVERRLDPLTGDEPFYVMTAISLIEDGDLDERNNYERRDFDTFYPAFGPTRDSWQAYPDPLPPHATASSQPGLYSKHGLGMALLVALPWAIGGRTLTLIVLALIAALVAVNMSLLARQFGASPAIAAVAALALALSNPLLSFSLLIFPEMTTALCIVYTFRRLHAPSNAPAQWLLVGGCAAALPWLHYRLAPVCIVLAAIALAVFRRRNTRMDWALAGILPAASALALFAWHLYLYGSPLPPGSDHAGFSGPIGTLNGAAGTLFDQQWGALIHNPILAVAVAGGLPFAARYRGAALALIALVVPYVVLVSAYRVWWGEWNPPARYLSDIVPLAAAPLGVLLGTLELRRRIGVLVVTGIPAAAVAATFLSDPQRMYNHPDGTSRLLERWSEPLGHDLTGFIPSYVLYSVSAARDRLAFGVLGLGGLALLLMLTALWTLPCGLRRPRESPMVYSRFRER